MVSACLLGENCKYNGGNNYNETVMNYIKGHEVIPVCPEVLGGLSIPRIPAEFDSLKPKYKRTIRIHNFILFLIKWTKILWTEYYHCSSGVSNPDAEIVFSSDCIKICSRG